MDSRCASERNVSFFDRPHPERLSLLIGEMLRRGNLLLVRACLLEI